MNRLIAEQVSSERENVHVWFYHPSWVIQSKVDSFKPVISPLTSQYMRLKDWVSDVVLYSTGGPQSTVLSPFLFTLYTSDLEGEPWIVTSKSFPMMQPLLDVCLSGTNRNVGGSPKTLLTGVNGTNCITTSKTKRTSDQLPEEDTTDHTSENPWFGKRDGGKIQIPVCSH